MIVMTTLIVTNTRLKLYEFFTLLHDSGNIVDNQPLRGGRLGISCDSHGSALSYIDCLV